MKITYHITHGSPSFECDRGIRFKDGYNRTSLHSEMLPLFNFSTTITTNINMLVLGDSIADQVHQSFVRSLDTNITKVSKPFVIKNLPVGGKLSGSYVIEGGGAFGSWRIIGMFLKMYESWAPANWNKGWGMDSAQQYRNYATNMSMTHPSHLLKGGGENQNTITTKTIYLHDNISKTIQWEESGNYDVLVFRPPGITWIPLSDSNFAR